MGLIELEHGVFVDEESGEIECVPEGTDRCLLLARVLDDAQQQIKAWERAATVAKVGLLRYQEERKAEYDGLVVRVQQNERRNVDVDRFVEHLRARNVIRFDLLEILRDCRVPVALVPPECTSVSMTKPFIVAERAKKRAPDRFAV